MSHISFMFLVLLFLPNSGLSETFDVCEVLQNLSALNGKVVSIRGLWARGDTGERLDAKIPCERPPVRDGWQYWDTIDLRPDGGKDSAPSIIGNGDRPTSTILGKP
jgi:hypothetical protein